MNNQLPQLHGVVALNKPKGLTSNQCLMRIKHLGQKKIGHAGTLDPMAEGVLIVLLGQATKIASYIQDGGGKVYRGVLKLGETSDTWDITGKILEVREVKVSSAAIMTAASEWEKLTCQEVPPYSAAKLDGKPLYELARKGKMVTKQKQVKISKAEVLDIRFPFVEFRVACSSGTYIRSLAHSLGIRLGCGAVLSELTREYSYPFGIGETCSLDAIEADPGVLIRNLKSIRTALPDLVCLEIPDLWLKIVKTGQSVPVAVFKESERTEHAILIYENCEVAIATLDTKHEPVWKITRGLWNEEKN